MSLRRGVAGPLFGAFVGFVAVSALGTATAARPREPAVVERVESLLSEGERLLDRERYKKAARRFTKVDSLTGGASVRAQLGMAEAYYNLGRYDEAIERAEAALELSRERAPRAWAENFLGLSLFARWTLAAAGSDETCRQRCAELERAAEAFRAVIELSEGNVNIARYNLAMTLERLGREREAAVLLDEFLAAGGASEPSTNAMARNLLCFLEHHLPGEGRGERTGPLTVGGEVTPPEAISAPAPRYTDAARRNRIQGVVIFSAIIDEEGNLACVRVLKGLPMGLSEATVAKALTWKFEPAELDGEPVAVYYNFTVSFSLQ